jgi:hypothetical protein
MKFNIGDKVKATRESSLWKDSEGEVIGMGRKRHNYDPCDLITVKLTKRPADAAKYMYEDNILEFYVDDCDLIEPELTATILRQEYNID